MKVSNDRVILTICIGIALVFWLFVKLSQNYTVWKDIKILVDVPETKALVNLPPDNLKVKIQAKGWDLLFNRHQLSTLKQVYSFGNKEILLVPKWQLNADVSENLASPRLKVLDINYSDIRLTLEDRLAKKVPLILKKNISFAEGYNTAGQITLKPDSILISGPQSMVKGITFWETDSLLSSHLKKDINKTINLKASKKEVFLSHNKVAIHLPVEKYTEKTFYIPLLIHNIPQEDSLSIFPKSVNIRCVVGLSRFEDLKAAHFKVEVDLSVAHLSEGKNTTPILLTQQPDFVKGVSFTPKAATFYIIKKAEEANETDNLK